VTQLQAIGLSVQVTTVPDQPICNNAGTVESQTPPPGIGRAFAQRLAADGYDLVVTGRRRDRLEELAATLTSVEVEPMTADLSTDEGVDAIAAVCAAQPLAMLVNNAGVAHYMPFAELPADKASELVHVKVAAPVMLARAAVPGMIARGEGTIINVSGMIAFSGPAPQAQLPLRRADDTDRTDRALAGPARGRPRVPDLLVPGSSGRRLPRPGPARVAQRSGGAQPVPGRR
jgi:NAD(P)-dependent dehydrogenase (short-subunit alcohol dehydrogenase family)